MSKLPRVLVVDDAPGTAQLFCACLSGLCDCTPAEGGAEALALYKAARESGEPFALILLDLAMPEISGFDVAQRIRESGDDETLIVFLTAYRDPETPSTAEGMKVLNVIHKPVTRDELRVHVNKMFELVFGAK